ncbi:MAG: hypothetical protein BWY11_01834 [Firmicutes bacterium ADurb.Bin182]|nr:MAG: hypothetical protein BWY11_01834 [Firmicutes bacterium ADurb.Bin182]
MSKLMIAAGIVLVLDTFLISAVSNMNLGVVMPALLGIPLLITGLFYDRAAVWFETGAGAVVKWALIAGYSIFLLTFVFTAVLIGSASSKKPGEADAVVVLGAGLRGRRVSYTLARRLDAAIDYALQYPGIPVVVTGSRGPGELLSEAEAMKNYLVSKGFPEERIIIEDRAKSTSENFRFSKLILDKLLEKPYRTAYVTTDFHLFRAGLVAKEEGLTAFGIGAETKWYLLPNNCLREYVAIWMYFLTGKIGFMLP